MSSATLAAASLPPSREEAGRAPMPVRATTSSTADGATHRRTQIDDFVREVADARVCGGVHFRISTEVGRAWAARSARWPPSSCAARPRTERRSGKGDAT